MLLKYFLNDYEMVPVVHYISGITSVFYTPSTLYFCCIAAFSKLFATFLDRISVSSYCNVY